MYKVGIEWVEYMWGENTHRFCMDLPHIVATSPHNSVIMLYPCIWTCTNLYHYFSPTLLSEIESVYGGIIFGIIKRQSLFQSPKFWGIDLSKMYIC
jgi:hypothetical protein